MQKLSFLLYVYLLGCLLLCIVIHSAGRVAREREQNTLDGLFLLPVSRAEILAHKWLAGWVYCRLLVTMTLAYPLVGILWSMYPVRVGLILLLFPWPTLLLANGLGLLYSVVCRRVVTAYVLLIATLLALVLVQMVGCNLLSRDYLHLWAHVGDLARFEEALRLEWFWPACLHQACLLLLAGGCFWLAFRLFGRQTSEVRGQVW